MLNILTRMEKRFKVYGSIFLTGIALIGTVLTTRGVHDSFLFDSRVNADNSYHLTLSKNNKYTSGTTKTITTDSGNYNVEFAYYNCSSMENGHATINNEGTIKTQIIFYLLNQLHLFLHVQTMHH